MKTYWLSSLVLVSALAASGVVLAAEPDPNGPRPGTTYKTRKGDTCVSIVVRAYGDRRRIDLMHKANPALGPMPHTLVEGTELVLPVATTPAAASPDAKLGAVRNVVRVEVPERKPGKVDDPLYRGNRVSTEQRSGADVLFRDESQLRLGEQTLVIILGDSKGRTREVSQDTTLVSGELTARLAKLGTVSTEGAETTVKGEARVSVDAKRTTRVATSSGTATLRAQKKSVTVKEGFGSKAELGKPPTPPKPLPPAPRWAGTWPTMAMTPTGKTASVRGELASPAANVAGVRVQVAHDSGFRDLISDVFVPKTTTRIEAEGLVPGSYFVRVASVDDDDFVGVFAAPLSVQVVGYREDRRADGTPAIVPEDTSIRCSELAGSTGTTGSMRTTRCVSSDGTRQSDVVWTAPPAPTTPAAKTERPAEPKNPTVPKAPEPEGGFEAGAAVGVGFGWRVDQPGPRAELDARYALPLGPGALVVGAAVGFEGYPRADRGGVYLDGRRLGRADVSHVDFSVGVPIAYRFGGQRASLMPILQLQPELILQRASFSGATGADSSHGATMFGLRGTVGTQLRLGPWALTGEGGFRVTTTPNEASAPFRGPLFMFGLRRFF